jgi:hypothetical protein
MKHLSKATWLNLALSLSLTSLSFHAAAQNKAPAETAPAETAPAEGASAELPPLGDSLTGIAKAEYEAGRILYGDGDYTTAVLKFDRAYQESKDPRLLWNMAAAEKNLRHYVRVESLVQRYMQESGDKLTETERTDAQALLDTVRTFIGDVTVKVQPDGSNVSVDGASAGVTPLQQPLRLEIGTRLFEVTKDGFIPQRESMQISGGSQLLEFSLEAELHEGVLRIQSDPGSVIQIDGKVVGTSEWQGKLPSGAHTVLVTADGYRPYRGDSVVQDNDTTTIRVTLEKEQSGAMTPQDSSGNEKWYWIAGGAVVAAGLGVGAYYLFRPEDSGPPAPVDGSLGTIELPLGF